ncbi:Hypothetical protein P9303_16091 [Prochlorococcus marinus str. MIT 9303]|uniref:Uncharacterized protein n=1 Tax=Prochlorococcus marinus (strain MIT 9303) TaxID=59922 RepID=A2CA43_PROM3|nr:Hypothetical protein P9303_16091 [Prochlorococcus marinus str. MIT 9303]
MLDLFHDLITKHSHQARIARLCRLVSPQASVVAMTMEAAERLKETRISLYSTSLSNCRKTLFGLW